MDTDGLTINPRRLGTGCPGWRREFSNDVSNTLDDVPKEDYGKVSSSTVIFYRNMKKIIKVWYYNFMGVFGMAALGVIE